MLPKDGTAQKYKRAAFRLPFCVTGGYQKLYFTVAIRLRGAPQYTVS